MAESYHSHVFETISPYLYSEKLIGCAKFVFHISNKVRIVVLSVFVSENMGMDVSEDSTKSRG